VSAQAAQIRVHVAEVILADVINELTRIGGLVEDLKRANGFTTITVRAEQCHVAAFERWLSTFTKGAGKLETLPE
ncbi:MAG: hypothetical protein ACRD3J_24705, partial [Thermoanaerobaculia bacterium]